MLFYFITVVLLLFFTSTFLLFRQKKQRLADANSIMLCSEDDSDIKIAGQEAKVNSDTEVWEVADKLKIQRENGNVDKANKLGEALSRKFIDEDGTSSFGSDNDEDPSIKKQRRLLLAFAVVTTVETVLSNSILRDIVVKSFYDNLENVMPDFYNALNISGSFSFYTLDARRGVDIEKHIGETFAMLVEKEGNPVMKEFGEALYIKFVDTVLNTVKSYDFL